MASVEPSVGIDVARADRQTDAGHIRRQREATMTIEAEFRGLRMTSRSPTPSAGEFPVWTVEKLRFADTDRNGHITNTVFAVCCQNARMELLRDPTRVPIPPNTQFVIARLMLEFRAEMHWPGSVTVGTRVERIGRSSVTLAQGLFMEERCVGIAESVVALMDGSTRRSMRLPCKTAEALRSLGWPSNQVIMMKELRDHTR